MIATRTAAILIALAAVAPGVAQSPPGQWRKVVHAMGTGYETGTLDRPVDGGLRIACRSDGSAILTAQIKGKAPKPGVRILLVTATRSGESQSFVFDAGDEGDIAFVAARGDIQLGRLWAAFRGGNNVTIRFPDGSFSVQSLIGVRATLPPRPCG